MMFGMNEMITAIRTVRTNARLYFLAYLSTWQPPKFIKPSDGIFLEIAPIHRCFAHAISEPNCYINSRANQSIASGDTKILGVKPNIEELLELFNPQEAQVLGYWLDASLFSRGRYDRLRGRLPQFGEIIKDDINFYHELGISAITTFAVGLDREYFSFFTSPAIFQYASLLWNNQTDLYSQLVEFCEYFYGEKEMIKVFDFYEQFDPRDTDNQYWKTYLQNLKSSIMFIKELLHETKDKNFQNRLTKLMEEFLFVEKWILSKSLI